MVFFLMAYPTIYSLLQPMEEGGAANEIKIGNFKMNRMKTAVKSNAFTYM